jgi:hypothetical protein
MAEVISLIWAENEAEYLCKHDWTGQIALMRQEKLEFRRGDRIASTDCLAVPSSNIRHTGQSSL